jgi:cytochrome P450
MHAAATETTVTLTTYADALDAYCRKDLAQAQYDEGGVVMADVLVNLHGREHRDRRRVENKLFRRETFDRYERELFPVVVDGVLSESVADGRIELVHTAHRMMLHLATLIAGVDLATGTASEVARLHGYLSVFIEALTLAQSTLDKDARREAIGQALQDWDRDFFAASVHRRQVALDGFVAGELDQSELPRDLLTTLLRHRGELALTDDVIRREVAFFLLVATHTSATALVRSADHVLGWLAHNPGDTARLRADPLFLQRCVQETIRLNPSSTVGMRRALAPVTLRSGVAIPAGAVVVIDLRAVNRDPAVFGPDSTGFDPDRKVPAGVPPYGLSFGAGMHVCIGQDLAAGQVLTDGPPPREHLYGLVALALGKLFAAGIRRDPDDPPVRDPTTTRIYWSRYPMVMGS